MAPRIEKADVVTFRLEVPLDALERLPDEVGAMALRVEAEADRGVQVSAGDSTLRFRPSGSGAELTEVLLRNDDRGLFFQRVLGPLMVRFRGDLHIRLCWNVGERNSHGDHAEVRVQQGLTTYPGLSMLRNVLAPTGMPPSATAPLFTAPPPAAKEGPVQEDKTERPPTAEELEIDRLLEEGRKYFDEYQRLKAKGQSPAA